jgi:hypothetical protein
MVSFRRGLARQCSHSAHTSASTSAGDEYGAAAPHPVALPAATRAAIVPRSAGGGGPPAAWSSCKRTGRRLK